MSHNDDKQYCLTARSTTSWCCATLLEVAEANSIGLASGGENKECNGELHGDDRVRKVVIVDYKTFVVIGRSRKFRKDYFLVRFYKVEHSVDGGNARGRSDVAYVTFLITRKPTKTQNCSLEMYPSLNKSDRNKRGQDGKDCRSFWLAS